MMKGVFERVETRLCGPAPSRATLSVLLVLLCAFLFFYRLGHWDLWAPDEPRYAEVAREMLQRAAWLVPYLNGELYTEKPMMFFWLVGIAGTLLGEVSPLAARLPSAVSATLIVVILFNWSSRYLGTGRAWVASAVLSTSVQFLWVARFGQMDLVFSAFVFLSLVGGFETLRGEKHRTLYRVLFYAGMTGATLTKGPLGIVLCWLAPLTFCLVRKEIGVLRRLRPLWGMLAVAAAVGSWYVPAVTSTHGHYGGWHIIWKQTYKRAVHGYAHPRWIGYYLYDLPLVLLPWTLWLPTAWQAFLKDASRKRSGLLGHVDVETYFFGFFICAFVMFSLFKGKRGVYLLPLFPSLALYIARAWPTWGPETFRTKLGALYRYLFGVLAILLVVAAAVLVAAPLLTPEPYRPPRAPIPLFALLFVLGGTFFGLVFRKGLPRSGWIGVILLMAVLLAFRTHVADPAINQFKSARMVCEPIAMERQKGAAVISYPSVAPQFVYYCNGPIQVLTSPDELIDFMKQHPMVLCLLESRHYEKLKSRIEEIAWVYDRRTVGHREMVVMCNYTPRVPTER